MFHPFNLAFTKNPDEELRLMGETMCRVWGQKHQEITNCIKMNTISILVFTDSD